MQYSELNTDSTQTTKKGQKWAQQVEAPRETRILWSPCANINIIYNINFYIPTACWQV